MNDKIVIKNLEVFANHGVFPEENQLGQKFIVSAELRTDFSAAAKNDDLTLSVNYAEVCTLINRYMTEHTFHLIETAADRLACAILDQFERIQEISLKIQKPFAPIGLPLETVSVMTERKRADVYLALGSNIGDKKKYIDQAVSALSGTKGCHIECVSELIETLPYGGVGQDNFLNGVLKMKTYLTPHELLDTLHDIEKKAGRKRVIRWGPRTLDLDILLYDDLILDDAVLHIPHIDMQNRNFVLEPLVQIAPYVRHPVLNKTAQQLLADLKGAT